MYCISWKSTWNFAMTHNFTAHCKQAGKEKDEIDGCY